MAENKVDNDSLLHLLECPVCLDYATSPIHQCYKGHLICHSCYARLSVCPTCRGSLFTERNRAMEKVAELVKFPCRFASFGCSRKMFLTEKTSHEYDCIHVQLQCPFKDWCTWTGCIPEVMAHLKDDHEVTPHKPSEDGWLYYTAKDYKVRQNWVFIFQWDKKLFRFVIKKWRMSGSEVKFQYVAHVQCIGMESCANHYAYRIRMFGPVDCTLGSEYEGLVTSTLKDLHTLKDEDCMVFDQRDVQAYAYYRNLHFILQLSTLE